MISRKDIHSALDKMILSASGWRGVFAAAGITAGIAAGGDDRVTGEIPETHRIITGAAAMVFAEYLNVKKQPLVYVGCDTRPTGRPVAEAALRVLLACGCNVRYAGFTAAPEIMAWARGSQAAGFIYISASHNPIDHNGLKFGLTDGGVLAAEETAKLINNFRSFMERDDCVEKIESLLSAADTARLQKAYADSAAAKTEALKAYFDFCGKVVWGGSADIASAVRLSLAARPLGVVCDFNGSARAVSVDREFFSSLGLKFDCVNGKPGEIVHRIVPEGESLDPCRTLLQNARERDASFALGYVPDCDGDRGNLVIWDDTAAIARSLEAQEVFALACVAELSHLAWTGGLYKAAVVVNDPTSMRVDRIAEAFGASVFRAEVGEANVVALARKKREEGYTVRILGEGSAGGNITHPSAVRDPVSTVLAIVKLLSVRSTAAQRGLFEIWCARSRQTEKYRDDFTLADIIASLPPFTTTSAYSKDAVLRVNTQDHSLLKDRYQEIFTLEWERRKDELNARYGFRSWQAIAYNGLDEKRGLNRFGEAGRGGLKISFQNGGGRDIAYIWMRGSATEPVFRIMADVEGADGQIERDLLEWQRRMIMEVDII